MQVFATDVLARDVTAAACRETEVALYVQELEADKLPTGRALTCTSFIPLVFVGSLGFFMPTTNVPWASTCTLM